MNHGQLTNIAAYLTASLGFAGQSLVKLQNLGAVVRSLTGDWIAPGDRDVVPPDLERPGWLDCFNGTVCKPSNISLRANAAFLAHAIELNPIYRFVSHPQCPVIVSPAAMFM